jgi:hypothetical protein
VIWKTPSTWPRRFLSTTSTRTEPPLLLLTKNRITVDVVPMQSFGVSAELPVGSERE